MTLRLAIAAVLTCLLGAGPPGYVYDPASTEIPNGISVLCPHENCAYATEAGTSQLSHGSLIFGSVKFDCANPKRCYTDLHLHGHRIWISGVNPPLIDHATGKTTLVFPEAYTVTYQWADKPGRWVLEDVPEFIPASWLLTGKGDESDRLCWLINIAHRLGRGVLFDIPVGYSQVIELPNGFRWRGMGDGKRGPHLLAAAVLERMRLDIGNYDPRNAWGTELQAYLLTSPPTITHKPDCKRLTIEDLDLDGDCFSVDWKAVQSDPTKWDAAAVSQSLRESFCCAGLAFINQSNRPVDGLVANLRNVHVHDFPGSCVIGHPSMRFVTENLTLGNSVSGRVAYYLPGHHRNRVSYGFSRTSVERALPMVCDGWKYAYGSGPANPWPENAAGSNVLGLVNHEHVDVRHGRKLQPVEIRGVDIDCKGSPFDTALSWSIDCRVSGTVRNGIVGCGANAVGEINAELDLTTENVPPPALTFASTGTANWNRLTLKHVNHRTERPEPAGGWGYNNATQVNAWMAVVSTPPTVSLKRGPHHAPEARQEIVFEGVSDDWPTLGLVHFVDWGLIQPGECIPTTVIIRGGRFNNRVHNKIGWMPGYQQKPPPSFDPAKYPVKVILDGVTLNDVTPGPFRGDDSYAMQAKTIVLRDCRMVRVP